jgi:hypothetical protein
MIHASIALSRASVAQGTSRGINLDLDNVSTYEERHNKEKDGAIVLQYSYDGIYISPKATHLAGTINILGQKCSSLCRNLLGLFPTYIRHCGKRNAGFHQSLLFLVEVTS